VDVAERLGVRRVDDPLDVEAAGVGGPRELVGVGDVQVAVGRLGELGQLGGLGATHRPDLGLLQERPVQLGGALLARLAQPADQLGVGLEVAEHPPL
jgi:hypothetical protein